MDMMVKLKFDPSKQSQSEIDGLRAASASGDLISVKAIFARWFLRPTSEKRGIDCFRGALFDAIENRCHEVTSYLLSMGVPFNMDIVVLTIQSKSYPVLQLLLDHEWDINEPVLKMDLPPPLMYALDDNVLTHWFLSHDAKPDADCGLDITPLSVAVERASFDTIKLLFQHGGTIEHGQLLHFAARRQASDRRKIVEYLLEKGLAINNIKYQNHQTSYLYCKAFGLGTPLHEAADVGAFDVVQLLLERGADPLIRDSRGKLALERAEYYGHINVVELLRPLSVLSLLPQYVSSGGHQVGVA